MEENFINYNQAVSLKELGFDEPCLGFYSTLYDLMITKTNGVKSLFDSECLAPLKQQVFSWFRDKHNYNNYIALATKYTYRFFLENFDNNKFVGDMFGSYEEAESACIDKLIEIIKEKK